jgi:glycosyltransferase involved in cell wall biosynthesis
MVSNRRVVARLVTDNDIGVVFNEHHPKKMAETVQTAFENREQYRRWKQNLIPAAEKYNWENESKKLIAIYNNIT